MIYNNGKKYELKPCCKYTSKLIKTFINSIAIICVISLISLLIGGIGIHIYLIVTGNWKIFNNDDDYSYKYSTLNSIALVSFLLWITLAFVVLVILAIHLIDKHMITLCYKEVQNMNNATIHSEQLNNLNVVRNNINIEEKC